jgi:NitT/TauT family transport system permease protein
MWAGAGDGGSAMIGSRRIFQSVIAARARFTWGDALALLIVSVLLYSGLRLAFELPAAIAGPEISTSPAALPWYALLSLARMGAAYFLSLVFTLVYGRLAARGERMGKLLLPLLDVLQSVPILSFLPVVLLSLSALVPQGLAAELASVVLIFTSQVWNMTFAWYQSLTTIPGQLREAADVFRFNGWLRFKVLELPFAAIGLVWNSIMSWAGGWFFLMAAEIFQVGSRDFRLRGLGSYLQEAANQGNITAIVWGLAALVAIIVGLDQLVWRPLLAWSDRFKLEMVKHEEPPTSWFYEVLAASRLRRWLRESVWRPTEERVDRFMVRRFPVRPSGPATVAAPSRLRLVLLAGPPAALLAYGGVRAVHLLTAVSSRQWLQIAFGTGATGLRVAIALALALAWTVPLGVAVGTNPRLARWLQPLVQIAASVPATALFPVFLLLVIGMPGGLNLAAVLLMLLGTQWYLLFNVIAGAMAIPQELSFSSDLLQLGRWQRWRTLILPALFPYIITGAITASGGAWNASIVAEQVEFGGRTHAVIGIGGLIARATALGDYPLLLAATLSMVLVVVTINRFLWRRLYRVAEERFRLE